MHVLPYIQDCLERTQRALEFYLPSPDNPPKPLHACMHYAVLNGGKRVRPLLIYATGHALGIPEEKLDALAASVEFIHAYSLVHDDLPAMDNDTLRRGKPTCHVAYGETIAILAGDALHSLAFETLANANAIEPQRRLQLIACLSKAVGSLGMVGGQALDLMATAQRLNLEQLTHMHRCKTGALIRASIQLAAMVKPIPSETFNLLTVFAETLGLAFQIQDDILDVEGDPTLTGKTQGKDACAQKTTYPALVGLEASKQWLAQLHEEALGTLSHVDGEIKYLKHLTQWLMTRQR